MHSPFMRPSTLLLSAGFVLAGSLAAQQPVRPSPTASSFGKDGHMYVGVDYYPEQWPRERWETDARLMHDAGFNVVRLAEFSWTLLEPAEGVYGFEWLDEVLALLDRYGIKAVLGTPTAAMPAWVARKYPEVLALQPNGQRNTWGSRKDYSLSSGTYRLLAERITRAMAEHFAATPNVIGWQIDNELAGPQDVSETSRVDFQDWLRRKFGTLEALNQAWGTSFWSHIIGDWAEITIPDCTGEGPWGISGNPGACLDWRRFNSWVNWRFLAAQAGILREVNPRWFITHNLMGLNPTISYYELGRDLDFASWDNYPVLSPDRPYAASMAADLMRGVKQKNFWIMEQTAGPLGWGAFSDTPLPGEIRKISYQQLAHGADAQIWFRWRTATAGREQYWHGLLGHDGKPLRRYREAAQVAREYRSLEKLLEGTTVQSPVAIVYDYESIWSLASQPGYAENDYLRAVARYYDALYRAGVNVDLVSPEADLTRYKLVLAPDLVILPDARARKLIAYVEQGGVLLADARAGVKDENNRVHERTLPGLLSDVLGITIEEYGALDGRSYPVHSDAGLFPDTLTAIDYADWVTPKGADVMAGYGRWPLESFAAVTRKTTGRGVAWYVGTVFQEETFYDRLIDRLLTDAAVERWVGLPDGVEASVRQGAGRKLAFLINHTEAERSVAIPAGKRDLLADRVLGDRVTLGPLGVAVIAW
jgi:beta-galactosidase